MSGLFLVGAGAAGSALGLAAARAGVEIVGVCDSSREAARSLAADLGAPAFCPEMPPSLSAAELVLVAVPDTEIDEVARRAAERGLAREHQVWLHCAGRLGAAALAPLEGVVRGTGALHPARVFPPGGGATLPPGTVFAVDCRGEAIHETQRLVEALGGELIEVPAELRPAYHAATVIASNYAVALIDAALSAAEGLERRGLERLLISLAGGAVEAVARRGVDAALSGPIRRGDADAVATHLERLRDRPLERDLYIAAGRLVLRIAARSDESDPDRLRRVAAVLEAGDR
ncbi:MAG: Rossmann-like and DUF2520 domain-containing protein [Polyangia bacterium]